jgi:hypothetical protein
VSIASSVCSGIWRWSSRLALGLALASTACSKKVPEPAKTQARAEEEPSPSAARSRPIVTRTAAPAEPPPIDPAVVPVEEDFRGDAEQKLTKKSDLRAELQRIEREISAPSK